MKIRCISALFIVFITSIHGQWLDKKMWVVDGGIKSFIQVGNDIYAGGGFNRSGTNISGAAALDTSSFIANPDFPKILGTVNFVGSDDAGGYYLGGEFSHVDGYPIKNFAHIFADGTLDETYQPNFNSTIRCGDENDSLIFAAGYFTKINDTLRTRVAVIKKSNGQILNISVLDSAKMSIEDITANDSLIICGGNFYSADARRSYLTAYNFKNRVYFDSIPLVQNEITNVKIKGDSLLLTGYFNNLGDSLRNGIAAYSLSKNKVLAWNPPSCREVNYYDSLIYTIRFGSPNYIEEYAPGDESLPSRVCEISGFPWQMYVSNNYIYIYQNFSYSGQSIIRVNRKSFTINNSDDFDILGSVYTLRILEDKCIIGGYFTGVNFKPHEGLIKFNNLTGEIDPLNFKVNGAIYAMAQKDSILYLGGSFNSILGRKRKSLAAIDLRKMVVTDWAPNSSYISSLVIDADKIYIGGGFNLVNDSLRKNMAILDEKGTLLPWDHYFNYGVNKIVIGDSAFYVIGDFDTVDNVRQYNFAAFEKITGELLPLMPVSFTGPDKGIIQDAVEDENYVYLGGSFKLYDGFQQKNFAAINKYSGRLKTDFRPQIFWNGLKNLQLKDNVFYIAGAFYFGGITPKRDNLGIVKKDGSIEESWMPNPGDYIETMLSTDEYTYIGGTILQVDGNPILNIGRLKSPNLTSVKAKNNFIPHAIEMYQNYPNPFNSTTNIKFYIKNDSRVSLEVYDILGRKVKTITEEFLKNGEYSFQWTGKDNYNNEAASGVYFILLKTGGMKLIKKVILLK